MKIPEKQNIFAIAGFPSTHAAFLGFIMKPWGERDRSDLSIMARTAADVQQAGRRQRLCHGAVRHSGRCRRASGGICADLSRGIHAPGGGSRSDRRRGKESGLFIFTNADLRFQTPQVELIVDRDKANKLGVTMSEVGATLATLLGGNNVNRFTVQGRSYQVIPQVPRTERENV